MKKLFLTVALVAFEVPAAADNLPPAYLGAWCGSDLALEGEMTWFRPDACGDGHENDGYLEFRREGFVFGVGNSQEDCRFISVQRGRLWPRWTNTPVPEINIVAKCKPPSQSGKSVYPLKLRFRFVWNKGDRLTTIR